MLALPTFCLSLRELLPIQLKWKEVFWDPAAIRLELGFGISRASPSQTCPCFLQKAVTIPFQKSLHIQLPSLADKTWASARRGFGGSIRLYWCEVGTATASSCRKPSHNFPCCGRKRRKIKGPKCSWKGVGGVSPKRLFLTNCLYITALWWPLCFLVLNWGRRRNSALQVNFSAEEKFPTTSRRTATELWARPSTHIWTRTHVHTCRAMHRVTYIQTVPDTSSCLCCASHLPLSSKCKPSQCWVAKAYCHIMCLAIVCMNFMTSIFLWMCLYVIHESVYPGGVGMFPT